MDKPHINNVYNDHTHSNNCISTQIAPSSTHSTNTSRSYKANRRRDDTLTPSKTRKDASTPDGKYHNDHLDRDTSRRTKYTTNSNGGGGSGGNKILSSSGSGKQKVTTPNKSTLSTPPGGDGGPSPNGNTSSARYHHRDVPPRFQLYGSSNNKHNKHTPNSKNPHSRQGSSKKSRDGGSGSSSAHWSGNNVPDNAWSTTSSSEPDSMEQHHHQPPSSSTGGQQQSKDRSRLYNASTHNPWSHNIMTDNPHNRHQDHGNWTSQGEDYPDSVRGGEDQEMIMANCELGDKKDLCSDFEELEITEGIPSSHSGEGHHRFRNSDSDAMKDGVSSSSLQVKDLVVGGGEDPLDGGGLANEGGLWRGHISRSSMGSSSSVNSAGSNSSWKGGSNGGRSSSSGGGGGGNNNYQRSASPRKHSGKYETNRSLSTSSSGKVSAMKICNKTKKNVMELDEAMDSLQGEPSGWGDLPSPKPSEVDTGTEVWGIPDDIKQKMKKDTSSRNGWTDTNRVDDWAIGSGGGVAPSTGWGDQGFVGKLPVGGNRSSQWATTPGGGDLSWSTTSSAATTPTHSIKPNNGNKGIGFSDNVKSLVDMGFSVADSEGTLKRNNNNFEAALGDLLALVSIKDDENQPDLSPSNFPLPGPMPRGSGIGKNPNSNSRLSPSSLSHSGGPSPRTTSPSSLTQYTKDQSFQLKPHVSGSTPVTPTVPISSTQNHLIQSTAGVLPPKLPRSISAPQGGGDLSNINTQNVLKVLSQQMKEHQSVRQQLINQLKNPQSPKHQQMLTRHLNQTNKEIMVVNQHLVLTNQLALQQQQQKQKASIETGKVHRESGTPSSATLSPPEVFGGIEMISSTSSDGQQRSSLNSSSSMVSSSSTNGSNTIHSMSRLQRIISTGGSQETFPAMENQSVFDNDDQYTVPTPIGPSYVNNGDTNDESLSKQPGMPATTSQSSLTSSGKFTRSVDEIPEFKPGVPWNPGSSSANNNHSMPSHSRKPVTQRLDSNTSINQRPDSIPLTTPNASYNPNPESYMDSTPDNTDYYCDTMGSTGYPPANTHLTTSQQYRRTSGSSPSVGGIGQPNSRGFSSGNHPIGNNGTTGFNNGSTGFFTRQQSGGQNFMPRPSPGTPNSSQMFPPNQFNPTGMNNRNRQRLYSQQNMGGGYNAGADMGTGNNGGSQRNRGYDSGRKWSFDGGNPWGVPEKSGTSIWSMESSNDSMLSPTVDSETVFSPAVEWRAPIRKPSLPVHLSAPTACVLLKNLSPQVDEISIREVCSEFGYVQNCSFNSFNGSALVFYQSKEEALQAKLGLEKNPVICGVNVQPSLATEKAIATFHEQRTPSHTYNHPSATGRIDPTPPSPWLSSESLMSPSSRPQSRIGSVGGGGNIRSPFVSTIPPSLGRHSEIGKKEPKSAWNQEQLAPGGPISSSSVWSSNNGVLPGISSSWGPTPTQSNPSTESGVVPDESLTGTSPSMTTYLPNGLF